MVSDLLMPSKVTGFLKCLLRHENQSRKEMCVVWYQLYHICYGLDFQKLPVFSETDPSALPES